MVDGSCIYGAIRPGGGAAPDAIKIGDRYLVVFGATGGSSNHKGAIITMWNKTLDPKSPDFKYSEPIVVATSDGYEENDAIDPGVMLEPVTGRLWLTYGTYFGFIRIVELDPKTGKRVQGNKPVDIAIVCEATVLTYHDGWYYLLATHGSCHPLRRTQQGIGRQFSWHRALLHHPVGHHRHSTSSRLRILIHLHQCQMCNTFRHIQQ